MVAIVTANDIAEAGFRTLPPVAPFMGRDGKKMLVPERPLLAHDRVRFAGEEVAWWSRRSRAAARDAADLIEVEYEELPAVIGFDKALAPARRSMPTFRTMSASISSTATPRKTEALIAGAAHVARVCGKPARGAQPDGAARGARLVRRRARHLGAALSRTRAALRCATRSRS